MAMSAHFDYVFGSVPLFSDTDTNGPLCCVFYVERGENGNRKGMEKAQ